MDLVPNHRAWIRAGMPTSNPVAAMSLTVADAVRRYRKMARSRMSPTSGPTTRTENTNATHVGQ